MNKKNYIAFIPAKGNSERLKNKNLFPIGKKKLIDFTIESAIKSKIFDKIYLSTDSQKIISYVKIKYKNIIIEKRNKNLCKNHTLASDVLFDFLKRNKNLKNINLVYLQPTSPQRNYNDIIRAARKYHSEKANSLISVCEEKINLKFLSIEKNKLINILNKEYITMNSQSLPKTYITNGAIYIVNSDFFIKKKHFLINPCAAYIMKKHKSVDIDTIADIKKIWPKLK